MIQVAVKLLAFDEFVPATLALIGGAPCLIVYRRVYMPAELPGRAKLIVPHADELPTADRESVLRLIDAARREGFSVVDAVRGGNAAP
jgi:hypothetical protein